ncbi:Ornithine decarboxylase like protein [Argiope bruennichi]|uniref:Ornithine decarboxylase like protein n=1 Tax=Argiope bruennichi TaxID=94029 RepID=A0A8T0F923_ARGBR|nr:Ornithine decarboxylase like protein [Argiope bruennichi]
MCNVMSEINGFEKNGNIYRLLSSKSSKKYYKTFYDYLISNAKEVGQDQPFYVFDLADILYKTQLWYERFPNVFPYYAVKANADPVLVRLFALLGYGFDCSTEGEIRALKYASSVGVDLMTFDSKEELHKISNDYPTARLVIRIKSKSPQNVYNLSKKFGCDVSEAEDLLLQAKALNLNVVGVSFHVGGLCDDPKVYTSTIDNARLVFDAAQQLGYKFTIMDIGAGFFGSEEREDFFYELSQEINSSLEKNFPGGNVEFIAEPGCYCVASAASLVTSIIGKKSVPSSGESGIQREYFLNDGFYQSFFEHHDIYDVKPYPVLQITVPLNFFKVEPR